MNKRTWTGLILICLGILPFGTMLFCGIFAAITGFRGTPAPPVYGVPAFMDFIILASAVYWPVYVFGIVCIIAGIVVLCKK